MVAGRGKRRKAMIARNINNHDIVDEHYCQVNEGLKMIMKSGVQHSMATSRPTSKLRLVGRGLICIRLLGLTMVSIGCGEAAKPWEKVVPASGQITFEGKPVEGAQITLTPVSAEFPNTVRPSATSITGGTFILGTYGTTDGAPAGEYKVSAVWFKTVNSGGSMVRGDNVLPGKYANADTSGITVVINDTETNIPTIDLKK
jgi:hypothetical protein